MRSLSLIEFPWLRSMERRLLWGEFLRLFHNHLKDRKTVDIFYFNLLLLAIQKWGHDNPKRIICEAYINILKFEHRLLSKNVCYLCKEPIEDSISFIQGFKPTHPKCTDTHISDSINSKKVINFFNTKNTIFLNDDEVERLFGVVMIGF